MNLNAGTSKRMKQRQRFKPSRRGVSVQAGGARREESLGGWCSSTCARAHAGRVSERILPKGITGDTVNAERADVVFPITTIEGKRFAIFM